MAHDVSTLASTVGSGWCRQHGGDSHACGASKEVKGIIVLGVALLAVFAAIIAWLLMED